MKHRKRYFFILVISLLVLSISSVSIHAKRYDISPDIAPEITLNPSEAKQLETLLQTNYMELVSAVSPDDRSVLVYRFILASYSFSRTLSPKR